MGLFRGFGAFFQGAAFVVGTPRIWPRAIVPVATALALWVGLGIAGVWAALRLAHRIVDGSLGAGAIAALFALPALFVALLLALALAQPLSGWALDGIVREQRAALALPALPEAGGAAAMLSSLGAALAAFVVGVPIVVGLTVVGWLVPPALAVTVPVKLVVAALLVAWNLADYPLALQGMRLHDRVGWFARRWGSMLGFGLAAVAFFSVPVLGLLALPCGVAGAARLVQSPPPEC
jgi:CysZ protein